MKLYLTLTTGVCTGVLVIVLGTYYLESKRVLEFKTSVLRSPMEEDWQLLPRVTNRQQLHNEKTNCTKLFQGDKEELNRIKMNQNSSLNKERTVLDELTMLYRLRNCSWLQVYLTEGLYNTELEKSFPLAFTFVVYESPLQVLRLLRLLYRPQNSYCIHYDAKALPRHKEFFKKIAVCLGNVVIPSKLESVVWGHYSVLGAQMNCLTDLLALRRDKQTHRWRYLLNLCGKELPLVTNKEIVSRLIRLNGSSSIVAHQPTSSEVMSRIKYQVTVDNKMRLHQNKSALLSPPFDISQYYKSQSYVALSYEFANFLTTNSTAIKIHEFFKKCKNPEEHFYATVFMLPGVPGGYDKRLEEHYFLVENVIWMDRDSNVTCHGKVVHRICIVSVGDLPEVLQRSEGLFFNKYFAEYDQIVMDCMEEKILRRNKLERKAELLSHYNS